MTKKRCIWCGETPGQADEMVAYAIAVVAALAQAYGRNIRLQGELYQYQVREAEQKVKEQVMESLTRGRDNGTE